MEFWIGICMVICSVALLRYVRARTREGGLPERRVKELEQRLTEVERRLSDIQEIVLAIDERLERQGPVSALRR